MSRREVLVAALWLTWDVLVFVLRWGCILLAALVEVAFALLHVALVAVLTVVTLGVIADVGLTRRPGRTLTGVMLIDAAFDRPRRRY